MGEKMDDVDAKIAIAVEAGNAIRDLDNLREKINEVTAAREKDLRVTKTAGRVGTATPLPHEAASSSINSAIKEEIAASTRALQKQREELASVNKIIAERGTKSVAELKQELAAANQVTAEYRQQRAELELLRAEQKMNTANKNLRAAQMNNEDPRRILALSRAVEDYRKKWIAAQQTAASAALAAKKADVAYAALNPTMVQTGVVAGAASKKTGVLAAQMVAARVASRTLGVYIGRSLNPAMLKLWGGMVALELAFKFAKSWVDEYNESLKDGMKLAEDILEHSKYISDRVSKQILDYENAIQSIDEFQRKESLTNVEMSKMSKLLREISEEYKDLGVTIDESTGKISGWDEASANARKKLLERRAAQLETDIENLSRQRNEIQKFVDVKQSGFAYNWLTWLPGVTGGKEEIDEAMKNNIKAVREESEKRRELVKIRNQILTFDYDTAKLRNDEKKDLDVQINRQRSIYEIQEMRLKGMEREAKLAEVTANWEGKRLKYGSAIDEFIKTEMKLYDAAKEKTEADYASQMQYEHEERVKTLKDELRIEQILLSGDERRARLLKWQNELKQKGITDSMAQMEIELREQVYQTREFKKIWDNAVNRANNASSYHLRETSQSTVLANSVDALRLQSRVLTQSPEMKVQQSQLDTLKQIKNGIDLLVGPTRTASTTVRS